MKQIEDTITPLTINEFKLLDRIRKLKLRLYEKGINPSYKSEVPSVVALNSLTPTLKLATRLDAGWENDYRFKVEGRTVTGKDDVGFGYYMGAEAMRVWTRDLKAQALVDQHRKIIAHLVGGDVLARYE